MSNQSPHFPEIKSSDNKSAPFSKSAARFGRLTYPQKFVLIALIFMLPIIAFLPLIFEQSTYIDRYGHKEAQGTLYLRSLWQLTSSLQELQHTSEEYSQGIGSLSSLQKIQADTETAFQSLESVHQQYGKTLAPGFDTKKLADQWQSLKGNSQNHPNAQSVADLASSIDALTKEVGDSSYLILDPDLDTYYIMDTVLLKMPENQDLLFQIFQIADGIIHKQASTPGEQDQLVTLIGRQETNLQTLNGNIQTALENNSSGAMRPLVDVPRQKYISSSQGFLNLIKANLSGVQLTKVDAETLDAAYLEARQASDSFYQGASQALETGIQTRITNLSTRLYAVTAVAVLSVLIALVIGLLTMRSISGPLVQLISATERLAAGEMSTRVQVARNDEVGQVADAFNTMAQELQADRSALETRTHDLDLSQRQSVRRTAQLQTITELSETIAQVQELNELFPTVTKLISERFGFYHVGIFLIDDGRQNIIMKASNSEGGKRMLERGYGLRLGAGLVGYAAEAGQARIALDVGTDAPRFDNPDLPDTRSEVALPLKSRFETIGILDVQSVEAAAFSNEDLQVLTSLANQVSIAIENARLLTETRTALAQAQAVYDEFTRSEWSRAVAKAEQTGFKYQTGRIEMIEGSLNSPEIASAVAKGQVVTSGVNGSHNSAATMTVPVKVRGEVIGILHIETNDPSKKWQNDEISLVEAVAERAAFALENARLFQDARRRAAKEQLISEATSKISGALNIENILQTTAQELERVLGGSEVLIRFQTKESK